jgi:hypothetical protein
LGGLISPRKDTENTEKRRGEGCDFCVCRPWEGEAPAEPVNPSRTGKPEVGNPVFGVVSVLRGPLSISTPRNAIYAFALDFALSQYFS